MSGFTKPSTPTKHSKPSPSVSSLNLSTSHKVLDDINYLLHLEVLKRNRENEIIIRQQIEEAFKVFQERRFKYLTLFAKYTTLVKHARTRQVLLRNDLVDAPTAVATVDTECIKQKLSSGSATDYINSVELEKFKDILNITGKYQNLPNRRSELVDLQNATKAIQSSIEAIEVSLENCTTQGLDFFTDTLDMEKFPKILGAYGNKDN